MVPAFTMCRSTREMPSFVPAASPRRRRRPSPWPPHRRNFPAWKLTAHPSHRSRTPPRSMSALSCWVDQQRRVVLHPPENTDVVDLHSTCGQQLFNIAIRQSVTEVPTHCEHDPLPREPEASERRPRREDQTNTAAAAHALEHAERRLPSMQL